MKHLTYDTKKFALIAGQQQRTETRELRAQTHELLKKNTDENATFQKVRICFFDNDGYFETTYKQLYDRVKIAQADLEGERAALRSATSAGSGLIECFKQIFNNALNFL